MQEPVQHEQGERWSPRPIDGIAAAHERHHRDRQDVVDDVVKVEEERKRERRHDRQRQHERQNRLHDHVESHVARSCEQ